MNINLTTYIFKTSFKNSAGLGVNTNFKPRYMSKGVIQNIPKSFIYILDEYGEGLSPSYTYREMCDQVMNHHNQLIKDHGIIDGTKRFNTLRTYVIKLLEGLEPDCPDFFAISIKLRFPSKVYKMSELYNNVLSKDCRKSDRIIRSILYANKLCKGNNKLEIDEITKKFDLDINVISEFRSYLREWKTKNNYFRSPDLVTEPITKVMRYGPNGKMKWESADIEAYALIKTDLFIPFKTLCELTGNQNLLSYMESVAKPSSKDVKLRYLTSIADKGNKSRCVAISDYWTQVLLNPLMKEVQSIILQYFKNNCSIKSHSGGFELLQKHIREDIKSYDISSWTDAFPAHLQKIMLEELFNPELAKAWSELVVECEWLAKGLKSPIKYGRGQGMGTAASFDIATLTDLLVLDMLYNKYYNIKPDRSTYNKIGDDLWCYDPNNIILDYYTKRLGIDINQSKTKVSTQHNYCGEFVSRNLNYNVDVSKISMNICRAFEKNPLDINQLCSHLYERGYRSTIPLDKLYRNIKPYIILSYIRMLYFQSILYKDDKSYYGINFIINKSLKKYYFNIIQSDPLINSIMINHNKVINGFRVYSISTLLSRINDKVTKILGITSLEYECSIDLKEDNLKENSFKHDGSSEPLNIRTSKMILAKSHDVIIQIGRLSSLPVSGDGNPMPMVTKVSKTSPIASSSFDISDLVKILNHLSSIDQGLTFKDLGVISETSPYRPNTTLLYNYVKSLEVCNIDDPINPIEGLSVYSRASISGKDRSLLGTFQIEQLIKNHATISFTEELKR